MGADQSEALDTVRANRIAALREEAIARMADERLFGGDPRPIRAAARAALERLSTAATPAELEAVTIDWPPVGTEAPDDTDDDAAAVWDLGP